MATCQIKVGTSMKNGLPMCIDCSQDVPSPTRACAKCKGLDDKHVRERRLSARMASGAPVS